MSETYIISSPTIFAGCDSIYWKRYGKTFTQSFKFHNPDKDVHIHLINPDDLDIKEILKINCNFSIEYISIETIQDSKNILDKILKNEIINNELKSKIKFGLKFFNLESYDENLFSLTKFIHFSCSRFIKLSEIWTGEHPVAAYDIDSINRGNIDFKEIFKEKDQGCLFVKGDRFVVSLTAFQNHSSLLKEWGNSLKRSLTTNEIWGFLDQDTFENLTTKYDVSKIERKFCDHTSKNKNSLVITGKGSAKYSSIFIEEQNKWK